MNNLEHQYNLANNHHFRFRNGQEVLDLLTNNEKKIIVFAFPACPWCQAALPIIDEVATELKIPVINYLDIKEMRDDIDSKEHEIYQKIYMFLKKSLDNPILINVPTVVVMDHDQVLGYHIDTVDSHKRNEEGILPEMSEQEVFMLKKIYCNLFAKIK